MRKRNVHKKPLFFLLLGAAALILLAIQLLRPAGPVPEYEPAGRFFVNDFADVLEAPAEDEIAALGADLQERTGAQVVAVTVPSLNGAHVDSYTNSLFRRWGLGQKDKNDGVMILIAVKERKLCIEAGDGLKNAVNDDRAGVIRRDVITPYLKNDNFTTGVLEGYKAVSAQVYREYGITDRKTQEYAGLPGRFFHLGFLIAPGLILALVIAAMLLRRRFPSRGRARRRGKPAFFGGGTSGSGGV